MAKKKAVKKKTTSKAVATVEESMLVESSLGASLNALVDVDNAMIDGVELDVMDDMDVFKNDIVIPKIHLIQSMSDLRKAKAADEGDYVDSRSDKILLAAEDEQEYLPIIVVKTFKRWQEFQLTEGGKQLERRKFLKSVIMTAENAELPYEYTEEGEECFRRQVISCYALLGADAQKGIIKPYIIDFYGASGKGAGRDLVSDIKVLNTNKKDPRTGKLIRKGLPSWVAWFKLGQEETAKNDDVFNAKTIGFGGLLPQEMWGFLKDANEEIKALMINDAVEIDDRDLREEAKEEIASADVQTNVAAEATATDTGI